MGELVDRELVDGRLANRPLVYRRRTMVARRSHGSGLEYGLIAAALAVGIFTIVAGLGARYGGIESMAAPAENSTMVRTIN